MRFKSIAIDGPAGAGKSTLAKQASQKIGFLYVDTGAIYRTVGLKVLTSGKDPSNPDQVASLLSGLDIRVGYADGGQRMYLHGEDVSDLIREPKVSDAASKISAQKAVRDFLLDFQRLQAREHNVIMDGRDIGTVVLPHADLKVFLTADAEARARRRLLELEQRGQNADYGVVLHDIMDRDRRDQTREIAPLRRAKDAVLLDTTELGLKESLEALLAIIKEHIVL